MARRLLACALLLAFCAGTHAQEVPGLFEVVVNGHDTSQVVPMTQIGDAFTASPEQWKVVGVVLKGDEATRTVLSTADLGVTATLDEDTQTLSLTVPASRLPSQNLRPDRPTRPELSPRASGLLINYDLAGSRSGQSQAYSLGHELRTSGRWGVLSSTGQLNWTTDGGLEYLRTGTRWQLDDYDHLLTYQAGDVWTSGTSMTALGGFRITKDPRGLDPYTPTWAMPSLGGIALDPGTVSVLSNEGQVLNQDVKKGPFTIESLPLNRGRNDLDVVVRDAYGRETTLPQGGYYFAPELLRQGLTTWDFAAGAVRQGTTDTYGPLALAGSVAHGVSDRWTLNGSAQAAAQGQNALLGAQTTLGNWGSLAVSGGASHGPVGSGWSASLGYNYQGPSWGFQLDHQRSGNWWDLASTNRYGFHPTEQTRAMVTYTSPESHDVQLRGGFSKVKVNGRESVYAAISGAFHRGAHTLSASVSEDLTTHEPVFQAGYRYSFDHGSVAASQRISERGNASLVGGNMQGRVRDIDVSATGEAGTLGQDRVARGQVQALTQLGDGRLSINQFGDQQTLSGAWSGSVYLGAGGVHAQRRVDDGFAVVRVPGVAGVPVMQGGRVLGKTDRSGTLVVAPLASLAAAKLHLDDRALPPEVQVESSNATVAPARLSGALVTFPVSSMSARSFVVWKGGQVVPAGAAAKSDAETTQVGFDGELFLEHPQPNQAIAVTLPSGSRCAVTLPKVLPDFGSPARLECEAIQ